MTDKERFETLAKRLYWLENLKIELPELITIHSEKFSNFDEYQQAVKELEESNRRRMFCIEKRAQKRRLQEECENRLFEMLDPSHSCWIQFDKGKYITTSQNITNLFRFYDE